MYIYICIYIYIYTYFQECIISDYTLLVLLYCIDIDECVEAVEDVLCDENAMCIDTDGSYDCSCKEGYSGDGFMCSGLCTIDLSSVLYTYVFTYVRTCTYVYVHKDVHDRR